MRVILIFTSLFLILLNGYHCIAINPCNTHIQSSLKNQERKYTNLINNDQKADYLATEDPEDEKYNNTSVRKYPVTANWYKISGYLQLINLSYHSSTHFAHLPIHQGSSKYILIRVLKI